ncbi:MAG: hypothetical protein V1908_03250 [Candidatus Peregrinibacteria bacterium]
MGNSTDTLTGDTLTGADDVAFVAEAKRRVAARPELQNELSAVIAGDTRPNLRDTLAGVGEAADAAAEAAALKRYQHEYESLPQDAKGRLTWEAVSEKLLANESAKLKKARAMQGSGHLFHITESGDVLVKDRGVEPVMYGWDKPEREEGRQLVQIYGRVPDLMATIKQWADATEISARVTADGYELFEDDGEYGFSEEMKRAAAVNENGLFVASQNRNEWRDTVLKNARFARFRPVAGYVFVDGVAPGNRSGTRGAVRLLRV